MRTADMAGSSSLGSWQQWAVAGAGYTRRTVEIVCMAAVPCS